MALIFLQRDSALMYNGLVDGYFKVLALEVNWFRQVFS